MTFVFFLSNLILQLAESDFAAQARIQAAQLGQNLQTGAKGAADQFNRFVEGPDAPGTQRRYQPERQDFWDDLSALGEQKTNQQQKRQSGSIGTTALRHTPSSSTTSASRVNPATGVASTIPPNAQSKEKDDWGEEW